MQENGKPYICYGFFKQPVYYADYISQVVTAHTMMLASFSFSTIQSGTLQISDVERFMTLADDRKAANELRYVDLNSAFQAVADQNTTQQERQESYEKYEAEQEKRIQELEEKISAIFTPEESTTTSKSSRRNSALFSVCVPDAPLDCVSGIRVSFFGNLQKLQPALNR